MTVLLEHLLTRLCEGHSKAFQIHNEDSLLWVKGGAGLALQKVLRQLFWLSNHCVVPGGQQGVIRIPLSLGPRRGLLEGRRFGALNVGLGYASL